MKLETPWLGHSELFESNSLIQVILAKTNITIGFRRSDLGGIGLSSALILRVLQVLDLAWSEKTTGARAPASLTEFDSGEACVARSCVLIRSLFPTGPHAC